MFNLEAPDKVMNNLEILPAVIAKYIPEEMRQHVDIKRQSAQTDLEYIQGIFDRSNNKLRMYGNAEILLENLLVYMDFPLRRKIFPIGTAESDVLPDVYYNLKEELLYCKQDFLFYLQLCVYSELEPVSDEEMPAELVEYMKKHEERLSGCYEFVKYDHETFEKIRKHFKHAATLEVDEPENSEEISIEPDSEAGAYKQKNFVEVFDGLISEYPWIFLPNNEMKDKRATVVVRVFDDSCEQYVMESELFNAINLKNPDRKPLKCEDVDEGFLKTLDHNYVLETFRNEITDIDFIGCPVMHTDQLAVPIATPTGEHCIRASDALLEVLDLSIKALKVFQKIKRNTCHMIPKFIAFLEKYFPPNIKYRYFITFALLKKMRYEMNDFWKQFKDKPAKEVRDVGPNGFTVEDLKKELKYLGYTDIFPEISTKARKVYGDWAEEEKKEMTTYDMCHAIEVCVVSVILNRFPSLQEFLYRQKYCPHADTEPCEACVEAFEDAEARIEAEKKEEQASMSSADKCLENAKNIENPEESVLKPAVREALSIELNQENEDSIARMNSFLDEKFLIIEETESEISRITADEIVEDNFYKNPEALENSEKSVHETAVSEDLSKKLTKSEDLERSKESFSEHQSLPISTFSEKNSESSPVSPDSSPSINNKCKETSNEAREESEPEPVVSKAENTTDPVTTALKNEKPVENSEPNPVPPDSNAQLSDYCMETSSLAREEDIKTYKKMMILAKKPKGKDSELERMESILREKAQRCEELEKTIKEKDEKIHELSEVENLLNQRTQVFRVTIENSAQQLMDKDKEIEEMKKAYAISEAANAEEIKNLNDSFDKFQKEVHEQVEQLQKNHLRMEDLEAKNSTISAEKNKEIEKLKKQQASMAKENKKAMEQMKRNASKSVEEAKKLTAKIAEKEAAENRLKQSNNELLEKLRKSDSNLQDINKEYSHLETEITDKNRIILELQKSAEKQVAEQKKTKKELATLVSSFHEAFDRILPQELEEIPDTECLICFYEMKSNQKTLKCEHCRKIVHLECASKWLKIHRSCAHCRREQLDPNEFPSLH